VAGPGFHLKRNKKNKHNFTKDVAGAGAHMVFSA